MLRIAIDFDETLFPTLNNVIEIYNKRNSANLELSQVTTYSLHESFEQNIADALLELYCDEEVYRDLQPYKGAVRTVKTLVERGHEIYVATASDSRNLGWKERLLREYFPFIPKDNLIRIYNKQLLNVDLLVEDNLDNLTQTFADRVCFDQLWNRSETKDFVFDIHRIHHWGELNNVINEIERKNKEWENVKT